MKGRSKSVNKRCRSLRSSYGQAIVEGACILPVMIFLVVLMVFLMMNASMLGTYNYRINAIAGEGARQYQAGKWWLGMERWQQGPNTDENNFDETGAENDVKALVQSELKAMGFPNAIATNFKFTPKTTTIYDWDGGTSHDISIMRVDFDVPNLPVFSGGIFPATFTLHAAGIATDAEYAEAKHGMCLIHVVDPKDSTKQRAVRVPILNATDGNSQPADKSVYNPWLTAGPSLGKPPTVDLQISCTTTGQLTLQQTDVNGISSQIGPPRPWGQPLAPLPN